MGKEYIEDIRRFKFLCDKHKEEGKGFWIEMFPTEDHWKNEIRPKFIKINPNYCGSRSDFYSYYYIDTSFYEYFSGGIIHFKENSPRYRRNFHISTLTRKCFESYHFNFLGGVENYKILPKGIEFKLVKREDSGFWAYWSLFFGVLCFGSVIISILSFFIYEADSLNLFTFINILLGIWNLNEAWKSFFYKEPKR